METPQNRMEQPRHRLNCPAQDYHAPTCPNCGSRHVRTVKSEVVAKVTRRRIHRCKHCPATWKSVETIPIIDREDLQHGD